MIVVPVYNKLVAPDADVYFRRDQFRYLAGRAVPEEKVVILVCKEEQRREDMTEDSFYPIGLSGVISEISSELGFMDSSYFIKVFRAFEGITPLAYRQEKYYT